MKKKNLYKLERILGEDNGEKMKDDDLLSLCFDMFSIVVICEESVNGF